MRFGEGVRLGFFFLTLSLYVWWEMSGESTFRVDYLEHVVVVLNPFLDQRGIW